jgi:all-trans-8'-apo-beta-carotenal 15,15'-oxygenase
MLANGGGSIVVTHSHTSPKVPLPGYFMVHDMILGREHLVFVVPPVQYDFTALATGTVAPADVLTYLENSPTRLVVIRKDFTREPVILEQPPGMVYHHGNLTETGDVISFHSLMSPDGSVLRLLHSWSEERWPSFRRNHLARWSVDLSSRQVVRSDIGEGNEFPRFDTRRVGAHARYLYAVHEDPVDLFSFPEVIRFDFDTGRQQRVRSGSNRTLGEGVFVPRPGGTAETDGWLLNQGYDAVADETFLEIRQAETLQLEARIRAGAHLPLGFHGNFYRRTTETRMRQIARLARVRRRTAAYFGADDEHALGIAGPGVRIVRAAAQRNVVVLFQK